METSNHFSLLDMIERPAFCVRDGIIVHANQAAQHRLLTEGKKVLEFLPKDHNAYEAFNGGCLYLNITSADVTCGASVTRIEDFDLFVLDSEGEKLEAYALASTQIKVPLSNIVNILDDLLENVQDSNDRVSHLWQNIYQLNRIVLNMSDANWLRMDSPSQQEPTDYAHLFQEIMEKMANLTAKSGSELIFQNLTESVFGLADRENLLRAVSNIISNAVKFSPQGSQISAQLTQKGNMLYFTVSDQGDSQAARCNVFTRYLRTVTIEDARYGLGLGMAIVHAVAIDHGGTVLVDTPECGGTRITMTLAIRNSDTLIMRTPVNLPSCGYTAGLDAGLLEFADVLPVDAFKK